MVCAGGKMEKLLRAASRDQNKLSKCVAVT